MQKQEFLELIEQIEGEFIDYRYALSKLKETDVSVLYKQDIEDLRRLETAITDRLYQATNSRANSKTFLSYLRNVIWQIINVKEEGSTEGLYNLLKGRVCREVSRLIPNGDQLLNFTELKHEGQFRKGGNKYFSHILKVTEYVTLCLNPSRNAMDFQSHRAAIVVAILHDILEDTDTTEEELREVLSELEIPNINTIINCVKKLTKEDNYDISSYYFEIFNCKICSIVKLADRYHNFQCLVAANKDFRIKYIEETRKYFVQNFKFHENIGSFDIGDKGIYERLELIQNTIDYSK